MIHLIRHGETDGNGNHYMGRQDLPLNATGRAQAEALVPLLAGRPISHIFASPLQRAIRTARPLAVAGGLPVEIVPAVIEIDFGHLENARKDDYALDLRKRHHTEPLPGGESLLNVWTRLLPFVERLGQVAKPETDIALVGHYWSLRMLQGMLSGLSFAQTVQARSYTPKTGSVTSLCPPSQKLSVMM